MALSPEEKKRLFVLLTLMSGGETGRQSLNTIQPILSYIEQKNAESKARKDKRRAETNALVGQTAGTLGTLGGLYAVNAALAGGGAAGAGTLATPTLLGATLTGTGAAGAGAAGAGAAGAGAAGAGAAGAGAGAGAAGAGTAGAGSSLAGAGALLGPIALAALAAQNAWETGGKDILRGRGTREDWTNQGVNMATGFLPNLTLRLAGKRSIGKMMTTGKSDDQLMRDRFRDDLKQEGIVDDNYQVTLADGSKFQLQDGKAKFTNLDGSTNRNAWDVDLSNPLHQYAISKLDPVIRQKYGQGDKAKKVFPEQYTGILVNAVTSNAKNEQEVQANLDRIFRNPQAAAAQPAPETPLPKPVTAPPAPTPVPPAQQQQTQAAMMTAPPAASVPNLDWGKYQQSQKMMSLIPASTTSTPAEDARAMGQMVAMYQANNPGASGFFAVPDQSRQTLLNTLNAGSKLKYR